MSTAARPVPISDEQQHIRANGYLLAEWQQLWDTKTGMLMNFRTPSSHHPFAIWDTDSGPGLQQDASHNAEIWVGPIFSV